MVPHGKKSRGSCLAPPTRDQLQLWSPLIASVLLTILVLVVPLTRPEPAAAGSRPEPATCIQPCGRGDRGSC